ncbi:hypothetical protein D3C75_676220 [compost metagenome]
MPATFFAQVRRTAHDQHEHRSQQVGNRTEPADYQVIAKAQVLDDRWQPEVDRVDAALDAEVDQAEGPDRRVLEHRQQRISGGFRFAGQVFSMVGFQHRTLERSQPFRIGVTVTEQEISQRTEDHRRNALQQEHPLPAGETALARGEVVENPAGEGAAEQAGYRDRRHEQRHDAATAEGREPLREIQHHARKEPGFGGTGKQAQGIELGRRGDEQQAGRQGAPGNHHQRNPAPRAEFGQGQVAWHAAQHVTDKEDAGAEAVHGFAELQRVEHLQFGKSNVYPVEVVEQVADENEGDQTQGDALVDGVFVVSDGVGRYGALCHGGSLFIMIFCDAKGNVDRPESLDHPQGGCLCA